MIEHLMEKEYWISIFSFNIYTFRLISTQHTIFNLNEVMINAMKTSYIKKKISTQGFTKELKYLGMKWFLSIV